MPLPPPFSPLAAPASEREGGDGGLRVACEHAERCGGCPIIGLPYGEQLALKRGRVVQSVSRYGGLDLTYTEPVVPADPVVEYRTRAKLIVSPGGKIGLFARGGGHQIVDIPGCRVLSPPLQRITAALRARSLADERDGGPLAPFRTGGEGALRAVDLREVRAEEGAPRVLVTWVVHRGAAKDLTRYREAAEAFARAEPLVLGVALNLHDGESPQILGPETTHLFGATSSPDRVGASTHLATFGSFVQAHRGQAERVHQMLRDALGLRREATDSPRVLDLYGGSGSIALGLAKAGARVHLVESFGPATAQARAAADAQGLEVTAECGDVTATLRAMNARGERFDAAVVNPPRRGMSPTARALLARLAVEVVAYVSCDPDTLARDLDHFSRLGYSSGELRPLDMIPLTDEVETVAILRRVATPRPTVVYEDDDLVVVEKAAHEPLDGRSEYATSLAERVRRLPNAAEAVPIHDLDGGTSGLALFVRRPALVALWSQALTSPEARRIYLVGARGVTPSKGSITRDLREDGAPLPARTRYRRLAVASGHSVLRVIPEPGRRHQIRRHLAAIGHPVLGDDRYGHTPTNRFFEEKNGLDRSFLHCVRVELDHPTLGARLVLEAALPGDLRAVLERTSGAGTLRFLEHKNALGRGGASSLPPPPDSRHVRGSVLDLDAARSTTRPEMTSDDDDPGHTES